MSDREPTSAELLVAINAIRGEIIKSRSETARLIEGVQISIDGTQEGLTKRQARRSP